MKIKKLLLALFCIFGLSPSYAQKNEELFLKVYEEKIKTLSEKIQKQEEIVKASKNKAFELGIAYVEILKKELKNKKGKELSEQEINDIAVTFKKNYIRFVNFITSKNELSERKFFFSTEFFEDCPEEAIDQLAMLKFYVNKYMFDIAILNLLIDQWESLILELKRN